MEQLGTFEPKGGMVKGRRRGILAVRSATCDLYAACHDNRIRVFNPKAHTEGHMHCVQALVPQLLEDTFAQSAPDFWNETLTEQDRLVRACGTPLEPMYEVLELQLNQHSTLMAVVRCRPSLH